MNGGDASHLAGRSPGFIVALGVHSAVLTEKAAVRRPLWIFDPLPDLVIALSWVPVFLVAHVLTSGPSMASTHRIQAAVALGLLISFLHQPLTFGLVYGDARQVALHRRLFLWAPVVVGAVAAVAAWRNLWVVVPVAAIWNLQHTIQQRYGVLRIYSGRSGYGSARLDRAVAYVPMAVVLLAIAAMPSTTHLVQRSEIDSRNAQGIELLVRLRPVAGALLVIAVGAAAAVIVSAGRHEIRAGAGANPAKWAYQASSLLLLASIVVDPIAGFIAYVTAHAVEYAVIVDRTARKRYDRSSSAGPAARAPGVLGSMAGHPLGRIAYFGGIVVAALMLYRSFHGAWINAVVYTVGGLHFTYDAVIWKLRKPATASEFGVDRSRAK